MTILALETSTNHGSVALLQDGVVVLEETFAADRSQSRELFPVLERVRQRIEGADLIAVGIGPGSYAGTRIAIAAALGLACSIGAELVGIPSVAALQTEARDYIAIGDARRDTFYFTQIKDGTCAEGPLLLDVSALISRLSAQPDAVILSPAPIPMIPRAHVALPSATSIAKLAARDCSILQRGDLEPLYLRAPHITTPKARPPFEGPR